MAGEFLGVRAASAALVVARNSGQPDMLAITVGSLDDPAKFKPQMVAYASRGHAWDHVDPAPPRFDKHPPQPG